LESLIFFILLMLPVA